MSRDNAKQGSIAKITKSRAKSARVFIICEFYQGSPHLLRLGGRSINSDCTLMYLIFVWKLDGSLLGRVEENESISVTRACMCTRDAFVECTCTGYISRDN